MIYVFHFIVFQIFSLNGKQNTTITIFWFLIHENVNNQTYNRIIIKIFAWPVGK